MASASDSTLTDEIIKRRLLIDGDGMGDERKLNTLIKAYLTFVDGDDSEEKDNAALKQMVSQAKQLDYVAKRTSVAIQVNEEAKEVYVDLQDQVQKEILETKTQIVESKALLEEATKHRKYSMEYDALAKLIESKPDRKMQELKRMGLQLELDTLKSRKQRLDDRLRDRSRTLQQLSQNIEMVKEHLKACDDKFIKRSNKSSRGKNGESSSMDMDSASQSEPPSPVEQVAVLQEPIPATTNGNHEPKNGIDKMDVDSPSTQGSSSNTTSAEKTTKSEKYEDLSESDGEDQ